MNRRTFAIRGAALLTGTVSIAGCTEETLKQAESQPPFVEDWYDEGDVRLPVHESIEVAEAGIERTRDADVGTVEEYEAVLRDRGLAVEALEAIEVDGDPVLSLEYRDDHSNERGALHGLGIVAGGFARLVRAGHDTEKLEALLLDPDGRPFGQYEVDTAIAEQYNEGEISAAEYARKVAMELEAGDR